MFKKKNSNPKNKANVPPLEIGHPFNVQQNVHVDAEFNWKSEQTPEDAFELEQKIGEGCFGVVYKASHRITGTSLAVKIISLDEEDDEINKEIDILRKCRSSFIVSYYGSCWNHRDLWILMEFCSRGSVRDLMESRNLPFTEPQIAYLCEATLSGLEYLHQNQIIHRDIKAANILMTENGDIKLADFGVSKSLAVSSPRRKATTALVGTPLYIAPEGFSHVYGEKTDIWALGITIIEFADGLPPYSLMHLEDAMELIPKNPSPGVKQPKKYSKEFNSFLSRCLEKEVEKRATTSELLEHPFQTNVRSKFPKLKEEFVNMFSESSKKKKKK